MFPEYTTPGKRLWSMGQGYTESGHTAPEHADADEAEHSLALEDVVAVAAAAALAATLVGASPHRAAQCVENAMRDQHFIGLPHFSTYVLVACTATRISMTLGGSPEDTSSAVRRAVAQAATQIRTSGTKIYVMADADAELEYCPELTDCMTDTADDNTCLALSEAGSARFMLGSDNGAADTFSDIDPNDTSGTLPNDASEARVSNVAPRQGGGNEPTHSECPDEHLWSSDRPALTAESAVTSVDGADSPCQDLSSPAKSAESVPQTAGASHIDATTAEAQAEADVTTKSTACRMEQVAFSCKQGAKFGLNFDPSTGAITSVMPDSQADLAGVKMGWAMVQIDGHDYSADRLRKCAAGNSDFVVSFTPRSDPQVQLKNLADLKLAAAETPVRPDLPTTSARPFYDELHPRSAGRPLSDSPMSVLRSTTGPAVAACETPAAQGGSTSDPPLKHMLDVSGEHVSFLGTQFQCGRISRNLGNFFVGALRSDDSECSLDMLLNTLPYITGCDVEQDPVPLILSHEFGSCITQRSRGVAVETLCVQLQGAFVRTGCNISCEVAEHLIRGKCDLFEAYVAIRHSRNSMTPRVLVSSPRTPPPETIYHL